jgi:hypothetical protein
MRLTSVAARQLIAARKRQPNFKKKRQSAKRGIKQQY